MQSWEMKELDYVVKLSSDKPGDHLIFGLFYLRQISNFKPFWDAVLSILQPKSILTDAISHDQKLIEDYFSHFLYSLMWGDYSL